MDSEEQNLKIGERLPAFHLSDRNGLEVRVSDYRQRKNLVVVFTGEGPAEQARVLLRGLEARAEDLRRDHAEVLAIFPRTDAHAARPEEGEGLPFRVLIDPEGGLHRS